MDGVFTSRDTAYVSFDSLFLRRNRVTIDRCIVCPKLHSPRGSGCGKFIAGSRVFSARNASRGCRCTPAIVGCTPFWHGNSKFPCLNASRDVRNASFTSLGSVSGPPLLARTERWRSMRHARQQSRREYGFAVRFFNNEGAPNGADLWPCGVGFHEGFGCRRSAKKIFSFRFCGHPAFRK